MGITLILFGIFIILTTIFSVVDSRQSLSPIKHFFKNFLILLFVSLILSTLIGCYVSLIAGRTMAIVQDSVVKTVEIEKNTLIEYWDNNGYVYSYIAKGKVITIPSNYVEVVQVEENITPYYEKWSYRFENNISNKLFWNTISYKYIFYVN